MILRLLFMVFVVFTGASCATAPASMESHQACEEQGGKWSRIGQSHDHHCNLPTMDAGMMCNDSKECQSACITEGHVLPGTEVTGFCYGWSILDGTCLNQVSGGVAEGESCED